MLVKVTRLDLPLWHQILVLEILRVSSLYNGNWCLSMICSYLCVPSDYQGFCVEARTLRSLFQTFDMYVLYPHNSMLSFDMVILCLWLTLFLTCLEASRSCLCCRIGSLCLHVFPKNNCWQYYKLAHNSHSHCIINCLFSKRIGSTV